MEIKASSRLSQSQVSALEKQLAKAREKANKAYAVDKDVNGKAYMQAMDEVRGLTTKINEATNFGVHTSIDGDIWAPR